MNEKSVHIIAWRKNRWAITKKEASRILKVFNEKPEAILAAAKYLELGFDLVVHNRDGSVEFWKRAPMKHRDVA